MRKRAEQAVLIIKVTEELERSRTASQSFAIASISKASGSSPRATHSFNASRSSSISPSTSIILAASADAIAPRSGPGQRASVICVQIVLTNETRLGGARRSLNRESPSAFGSLLRSRLPLAWARPGLAAAGLSAEREN